MEREEDFSSPDCHEDATDLVCGLIRELSSLKLVNASLFVIYPMYFLFSCHLLFCPFFLTSLSILLLPLPRVELLTCNTIGQCHPLDTHLCVLIGWSV